LGFKETRFYEGWIGYSLENKSGFGIIEDTSLARSSSSDIANLVVENVDVLWHRVKNKVEVEHAPVRMPWGTRKFIVLDPDGMRIAFIENEENR